MRMQLENHILQCLLVPLQSITLERLIFKPHIMIVRKIRFLLIKDLKNICILLYFI